MHLYDTSGVAEAAELERFFVVWRLLAQTSQFQISNFKSSCVGYPKCEFTTKNQAVIGLASAKSVISKRRFPAFVA